MEDGEKVVYSRSQLLCAGTKPLEDALEMFVPESKRFMNSDTELWNFLRSLKRDFSPVILRSKDVYGYSSCRSVVPEPGLLSASSSRRRAREQAQSKPPPARSKPPAQPSQQVKRKRRGMRLSCKKRRRKEAASEESAGSSCCSSPAPSEPEARCFPVIRVRGDVSCEAEVAAARIRAQRILRVNLQPVVRIRRYPHSS